MVPGIGRSTQTPSSDSAPCFYRLARASLATWSTLFMCSRRDDSCWSVTSLKSLAIRSFNILFLSSGAASGRAHNCLTALKIVIILLRPRAVKLMLYEGTGHSTAVPPIESLVYRQDFLLTKNDRQEPRFSVKLFRIR